LNHVYIVCWKKKLKNIEIEFDVLYWISFQTEFAQSAYSVVTEPKRLFKKARGKKKTAYHFKQAVFFNAFVCCPHLVIKSNNNASSSEKCVFVFLLLWSISASALQ